MGSGDHHRRDEKSRPIEQPSAEVDSILADVAAVEAEPLASVEDVWAASEGYTPLQDMQAGGGMFSDGGSTTFFTSYPGSFFADMAAFGGEDDDEGDDSSHQEETGVAAFASLDQGEESDFRSVADNALMMLEDEYQRTVSHQYPPQNEWRTETAFRSDDEVTSSPIDAKEDEVAELSESFVPEFDQDNMGKAEVASSSFRTQAKVLHEIDAEAVRRAVQTIQMKNPKLKQNLQQWEQSKKEMVRAIAPRLHPIIPSAPLAAFRKRTAKAIQASANLSRSACIAEALRRFNVLQNDGTEKTLRIHIVGCDQVECESPERLRIFFGPVVRWIGAYAEAPSHIHLDLIGPNIPAAATQWPPLDLLPANCAALKDCLQSAKLSCHGGVYEDWHSAAETPPPDLAISFNAGVWGYREWKTTIQHLVKLDQSIPFVFTAYTLQEAEDDEEVVQDVLQADASSRCDWEPEANAFSSNQDRDTVNAPPGRPYPENAAWQGWRL